MLKKAHIFFFFLLSVAVSFHAANALKNECECGSEGGGGAPAGSLLNINQRRSLVSTEYGEVWSVDVNDGHGRPYHIQFITLEPDSLFLPVLLHADMVFYVNTGSGRLSWTDDDEIRRVDIKRGDLYRLDPGTVFFVQSNLETERPKLRINAIFASNSDDDLYDPAVGAYSSIRDIVRGFDPKLLRSAFKVSEEVIESIVNGTDQSAIVHAIPTKKETFWDSEARFLKTFLLGNDGIAFNSKKTTTYNIFDEEPDFENCNGWSLTVNKKTSSLLKGSNIGLFMVNLTKGSMMGPHWNPRATEIAIVLQGQGMVRVVCSSTAAKKSECRNMRFRVHEGDVFAVPRFHPMAQMSFNNNSLVFMGFSTTEKKNNPQFLAGKYSVLQTLDKQVLAASFNVTNTTIDQLLSVQPESFIIDCTSCAEEEEKVMLEEIKKEREEEEAKKREEEEARKREKEEQERKREEEERETQEEERKREDEEARKREEEEATREREEQAARERGEQTTREQGEQTAREREELAAREREEQAAREREEQAAKQQEEQAPKEQEEQEAAREREEREAAREQEEEGRQQEKEGRQGDDERRQQEKRERERRQQEELKRREEDERREREEARRQQEEGQGRGEQTEEQEGEGGGFDAEEGRRYLSVLKI